MQTEKAIAKLERHNFGCFQAFPKILCSWKTLIFFVFWSRRPIFGLLDVRLDGQTENIDFSDQFVHVRVRNGDFVFRNVKDFHLHEQEINKNPHAKRQDNTCLTDASLFHS
jgi:hypothetical protein